MKKPLAVIVGAGPGVSASVAKKFGHNDYRIVLLSRKQESVDALASDLVKLDIEACGMTADATNSESIIAAFDRIKSEYGNPDVLIYNAGANTPVVPTELKVEDLLNDFEVNVAGALVSAQQVIPAMVEGGKGTLLFTGGGLAMNPIPARASASLTKAGLRPSRSPTTSPPRRTTATTWTRRARGPTLPWRRASWTGASWPGPFWARSVPS